MKFTTNDECDKQKICSAYNLCRPPDRLGHDLASIGFRQTKHLKECVKILVHLDSSCEVITKHSDSRDIASSNVWDQSGKLFKN